MQTILCYGDSNTFGYSVEGDVDGRYAPNVRWPGILQSELGGSWRVLEAGLNGRTTVTDDPVEGAWKNGRTPLLATLHSNKPLDWVIVKLGTNDLKIRFDKTAKEITNGVATLIKDIKAEAVGNNAGVPEILLVAPAAILQECVGDDSQFLGREVLSHELKCTYRELAEKLGVFFLDAGEHIDVSRTDGVHLSSQSHHILGVAIAKKITEPTSQND